MALQIRKLTTDCETQPEFRPLFDAYAKECGVTAFGNWHVSWELYKRLEQASLLHAFCALKDGKPVGLIVGIVSEHFHYSLRMMTIDTIFVKPEYRNTSISARLISSVMRRAKNEGVTSFLISCPPNSDLDKALAHQKNYQLISKLYRRK